MEITFKEIAKEDMLLVVEWLNDPVVKEYIAVEGEKKRTIKQQMAWYKEYQMDKGKQAYTVYCDKIPIGYAGIFDINDFKKSGKLFITIGNVKYWGQGIGTFVTKRIIDIAFNQLDLLRLELEVDERNKAASTIYQKAGFHKILERSHTKEDPHNVCMYKSKN